MDTYKKLDDYEMAVKNRIKERFGDCNEEFEVYIYGYGMMGRFVYQVLKDKLNIAGFIDADVSKQSQRVMDNLRIYCLQEVDIDAGIIIASLAGWSTIYHKCKELGYRKCCHYEELAFFDHDLPHWNEAFKGMADSILKNQEQYIQIYNLLNDDTSKEVFRNICYFRLTMDISYTETAHRHSTQNGEKSYFDPVIIKTSNEEVFVDCGGYCGETTKDFIQFSAQGFNKIYIFEPDMRSAEKIALELQGIKGIKIFPYGVGGKTAIQYFNAGGVAGCFAENGEEQVRVVKLSDVINEKISFIKMDIEGMEAEALQGACEIIKRDKPKLAISVYHKCDDIFAIAKQILNYRADYRVYMRHYSLNCDDTVMYFV